MLFVFERVTVHRIMYIDDDDTFGTTDWLHMSDLRRNYINLYDFTDFEECHFLIIVRISRNPPHMAMRSPPVSRPAPWPCGTQEGVPAQVQMALDKHLQEQFVFKVMDGLSLGHDKEMFVKVSRFL